MKIIKRIFIFIIALVAVGLIAAIFVSREYTVSRSVSIAKPAPEVFGYIKYLRNQNDFSKWAGMDPAMKKEFKGTDAAPGFVSAWDSEDKHVGKGEQTISKIDEASGRVDYDIHFIRPMDAHCDANMQVKPEGAGSRVAWTFHGVMPYPFNVMRLFMSMEKSIGGDLQIGLDNLKKKMEAMPAPAAAAPATAAPSMAP